jgi:hypothetical protein
MAPFIRPSPSPVGGTPSILFSGSGTGSPTASNPSGNEQFQAISALEQFNKHSLEVSAFLDYLFIQSVSLFSLTGITRRMDASWSPSS